MVRGPTANDWLPGNGAPAGVAFTLIVLVPACQPSTVPDSKFQLAHRPHVNLPAAHWHTELLQTLLGPQSPAHVPQCLASLFKS
jgi:hypothetical protein